MKQIKIKNHPLYALVDDKNFSYLSKFIWWLDKHPREVHYAWTWLGNNHIYMHELVLPLSDKKLTVDHKNNNGLDNQEINLRPATRNQQNQNIRKQIRINPGKTASQYKGVAFREKTQKWESNICVNEKRIYLGSFKTEKRAAVVYNEAAIKHFGEFAALNIIGGIQ